MKRSETMDNAIINFRAVGRNGEALSKNTKAMRFITAADLAAHISDSRKAPRVLVVDMRMLHEFEGGRVRGAISVDIRALHWEQDCRTAMTDAKRRGGAAVVLYCDFAEERSPRAYEHVGTIYTAMPVYVLLGGYNRFFEQFAELCIRVVPEEVVGEGPRTLRGRFVPEGNGEPAVGSPAARRRQLQERVRLQELKRQQQKQAVDRSRPIVVGLTGISCSGKSWVARRLQERLAADGKRAAVVGQEKFRQPAASDTAEQEILEHDFRLRGLTENDNGLPQVTAALARTVPGKRSLEHFSCTDWGHFEEAFFAEVGDPENDVVIVEGTRILFSERISRRISFIYSLDLERNEARRRRCEPPGAAARSTAPSNEEWDTYVWPQHALYEARLCQPLNDGVMTIPGIREETEGEVAAVVDGIINSAGRGVLKGFK